MEGAGNDVLPFGPGRNVFPSTATVEGVATEPVTEASTDGGEGSGEAAVFLDRDGVINRRSLTLVRRPAHLELLPGVPGAVARLSEAGYRIVVVTNQRPVAWGLIDGGDLDAIHERIREAIEAAGGHVDQFRACRDGFFANCECGKPNPGMLTSAAEELGLDPGQSWMVGDKPSDVEAGRRFGARTAWVTGSQYPWERWRAAPEPDVVAEDLPAAVDRILGEPEPVFDAGEQASGVDEAMPS